MDFENINLSPVKSEKRIKKAREILGSKVVTWIIGFALFLLGATRKDVSQLIDTPYETFNSFVKRMWKDGIVALEDRRFSDDPQPVIPEPSEPMVDMPTAKLQGDEVIVHLPHKTSGEIRIPAANKVMVKAVLLTLLQNKIMDSETVSHILGYTQSHILYLKRQIFSGSTQVLLDNRQGQKQCYVFKPEVVAQLIQQYCVNVIVGQSTSSAALASQIKTRCGLDLSHRSIRHQVKKLGLKAMTKTLPGIIGKLKKNSGN